MGKDSYSGPGKEKQRFVNLLKEEKDRLYKMICNKFSLNKTFYMDTYCQNYIFSDLNVLQMHKLPQQKAN